jgi:hypothetical protein
MPDAPYTRAELAQAQDGRWPERGPNCDPCGVQVPIFADRTDATRWRVLESINNEQRSSAKAELLLDGAVRRATHWRIRASSHGSDRRTPPEAR